MIFDNDPEALPQNSSPGESFAGKTNKDLIYSLLLVLIFLVGAYFRLSGINWDERHYLHPDERFLVMVESSLEPVKSLGEYFDTATSTLNPHNRGHGFFVYGTLPIFVIRYLAEFFDKSAYGQVHVIGRPLSALVDLGAVFLAYLIAKRLYDRRVGLLAAAFGALAVLQIQLSHFLTVDTFANFFTWLALYEAVRIATNKEASDSKRPYSKSWFGIPRQIVSPVLLFGLALGMAAASKINAIPVAGMLPVAGWIYLSRVGPAKREKTGLALLGWMGAAAFLSLLVFRVFQPYAFSGPGFFGLKPNPLWLDNLNALRSQIKPDSGFPPSIQWFNRSFWFSGKNMILWGIGLPMGVAAVIGFLGMGWRILRGEWRRHLLIWSWVGLYFLWQSTLWNPTMRYQLPVYPGLAIFAAWVIVRGWDWGDEKSGFSRGGFQWKPFAQKWARPLVLLGGALALTGTLIWAFAFTRIYSRQITRLEASRWIFQNLPGPVNLQIKTETGVYQQPLPVPYGSVLRPEQPFQTTFTARASGILSEVTLGHVQNVPTQTVQVPLSIAIMDNPAGESLLASSSFLAPVSVGNENDPGLSIDLIPPAPVVEQATYYLQIEVAGGTAPADVCGPVILSLQTDSGQMDQPLEPPPDCVVRPGEPVQISFVPRSPGTLTGITFGRVVQVATSRGAIQLRLELASQADNPDSQLGAAVITLDRSNLENLSQDNRTFRLPEPVAITEGQSYFLKIDLGSGGGQVSLAGAAIANETSWDDGLPMRVDGYDGFGGIYQGGLNFEMYWPDNADKRQRFIDTLNQADAIIISSSRQWASLTRLPEKYPLTIAYYRHLLGCPEDRSVEWCYNVAQEGMFEGSLGFRLARVYESDPTLGPWRINDQFAEEAFTVYDHPKVFIFLKSSAYDPEQVSRVFDQTPLASDGTAPLETASAQPVKSLLLPQDRLDEQQAGGTWAELFPPDGLANRYPFIAAVIWYLVVAGLGLAAYPVVRLALPGLADHGYPFARTVGLLLVSYPVWLGGSFGIPLTRLSITGVIAGVILLGGALALLQRKALQKELRTRGGYFVLIESLALLFFLFFLFIRLGNPDLWHPWKGGEKPMDFSYFNAVLKSTTFPPYDPWFAGGYINYYYYGFVYVGVLVKWLGIEPSIAYNLILPTLFSLVGLGAFSIGFNLMKAGDGDKADSSTGLAVPGSIFGRVQHLVRRFRLEIADLRPVLVGLSASLGVVVLGNLGTVRMIFRGYQKVAAPPEPVLAHANFFLRWWWALQGFFKVLGGSNLPFSIGDWYWIPSRVIPAPGEVEPITEFPFFTFLYADLHAHMIVLPLTFLALAWAISVVLARGKWAGKTGLLISFLVGGLAIGVLRPTNTWDFPTFLALGGIAVGYAIYQGYSPGAGGWFRFLPAQVRRALAAFIGVGVLAGISIWLFEPYVYWYALGYTSVSRWTGTHTPTSAYLTHWGVFLFLIVSWMTWETRDWMASTPVSSLRKLVPYRGTIFGALVGLLATVIGLRLLDVYIAWLVIPLATWAGVLLLRPGLSDVKRLVLFLVGTGLVLTVMVELIVLSGDIGRMNTVFKFYLQVWTMFGVSAAASLGWLLKDLWVWKPGWRKSWQVALIVLVFSAALFPLLGGLAKIKDRMASDAPHTLDGMAYMPYSTYEEKGRTLHLDEDYRAIKWMQENVEGSPVIVEANTVEYRWGSRYTINTGLPGVVGWNWHQRQQRAASHPEQVSDRVNEIGLFYQGTDQAALKEFLQTYRVQYIIVGQLERAYYDGPGIDKFDRLAGILWQEVYRDGETAIYQVIR